MKKNMVVMVLMLGLASFMPAIAQDPGADVDPYQDKGPELANEGSFEALDEGGSIANDVRKALNDVGLQEGWNPEKQCFVQFGYAGIVTKNPATDKLLSNKREIAFRKAHLTALANIAKSMQISAEGNVKVASLLSKFVEIDPEIQRQIEDATQAQANAQRELDAIKQDIKTLNDSIVEEPTVADLAKKLASAFLISKIKELDSGFNPEELLEPLKAKRDEQLQRLQEAESKVAELQEEAGVTVQKNIEEFKSQLVERSSQILYGTSCYKVWERYSKDEGYQMAVVLVWSPKLNEIAIAMLNEGEIMDALPPGKGKDSAAVFAEENLAQAVGFKSYIDEDGKRGLIAFGSEMYEDGFDKAGAIRAAQQTARENIYYALKSEVDVKENLDRAAIDAKVKKGDRSQLDSSGNLVSKGAVDAGFKIEGLRGLTQMGIEDVVHPISQQKLVVVAMGIRPDAWKAAKDAEDQNFAARIKDIMHGEYVDARSRQQQSALKDAEREGAVRGARQANQEVSKVKKDAMSPPKTQAAPSVNPRDDFRKLQDADKQQSGLEAQEGKGSTKATDLDAF